MVVDIHSRLDYPSSALSNFAAHPFVFDGVECSSMEGLLQSFKFDDPEVQVEVCRLVGIEAKRRGQERNEAWKTAQMLWWKGTAHDRHGREYQRILDRAFDALARNDEFIRALLETHDEPLTHSIGNDDPSETVLTEDEFCSRLTRIRSRLHRDA